MIFDNFFEFFEIKLSYPKGWEIDLDFQWSQRFPQDIEAIWISVYSSQTSSQASAFEQFVVQTFAFLFSSDSF